MTTLDRVTERLVAELAPTADVAAFRKAIFSPTRKTAGIALSRQKLMYLLHIVCGETLTAIGVRFSRDRTTAAYACTHIEDLRDDPIFDAELDALNDNLIEEFPEYRVAA